MRLKIGFLVRRKMRRWSEGKGPLSKEQLDRLDEAIIKQVNPSLTWYFNQVKEKNEQKEV